MLELDGREGGTGDTHHLDEHSLRTAYIVYSAIGKKRMVDQQELLPSAASPAGTTQMCGDREKVVRCLGRWRGLALPSYAYCGSDATFEDRTASDSQGAWSRICAFI